MLNLACLDIQVRYWVGKQINKTQEKTGLEIKNWGSSADNSVFVAVRLLPSEMSEVKAWESGKELWEEAGPAAGWAEIRESVPRKEFQGARLSDA